MAAIVGQIVAMSSTVPSCVICTTLLHKASERRVLAGAESEVILRLVQPNFVSASNTTNYVCRKTCFAALQKIHRHAEVVNSVLTELGAPVLISWREFRSVGTQQPAEVQLSQVLTVF